MPCKLSARDVTTHQATSYLDIMPLDHPAFHMASIADLQDVALSLLQLPFLGGYKLPLWPRLSFAIACLNHPYSLYAFTALRAFLISVSCVTIILWNILL